MPPADPHGLIARHKAIHEIVERVARDKCARLRRDELEHIVDRLTVTDHTLAEIARAGEQLARTETSHTRPIAFEYWHDALGAPLFTKSEVNVLVSQARKAAFTDGVMHERRQSVSATATSADAREEWNWAKRAGQLEQLLEAERNASTQKDFQIAQLEREIIHLRSELEPRSELSEAA